MRRWLILLVPVLASLLLQSCISPPPRDASEIVYGFTGDPIIFNPILSTDATSGFINQRIYQGLLELDEQLQLVPCLAETVEYSADHTILRCTLRRNVRWHDGRRFTAADVAFTLNCVLSPSYTGVRKTDFASLAEVRVLGDYQLELQLRQPDAALLSKLDLGILPEHVFGQTPLAALRQHPSNLAPIGTGPYRWQQWAKGQYLVLQANPDYWREGPHIAQIRIRFFQDNQVMLSALEAGEVDYMGSIPVDDLPRLRQSLAERYDFYQFPDSGYSYIGLKQTHPILRDRLVRQALAYGLDRQLIVNTILRGYGSVLHANLPPTSWAYNPDLNAYAYDPALACRLLQQAGWVEVGRDGVRRRAGQRLAFHLLTTTGNVQREATLNIVKEQWRAIGVEVTIDYYEWSVLCDQYLDRAQFESYMLGWSLGVDPDCYLFFHSDAGLRDGVLLGMNDVEYSNPRIDQLLEAGRLSWQPDERRRIYQEVQQIVNQDLPYIFLYSQNQVTAVSKRIGGLVCSPLGLIYPEKWYIQGD